MNGLIAELHERVYDFPPSLEFSFNVELNDADPKAHASCSGIYQNVNHGLIELLEGTNGGALVTQDGKIKSDAFHGPFPMQLGAPTYWAVTAEGRNYLVRLTAAPIIQHADGLSVATHTLISPPIGLSLKNDPLIGAVRAYFTEKKSFY